MEEVRISSAWVASHSNHVKVDSSELERVVDNIQGSIPKVEWNFEGIHYFDNGPLTVQYLFVLDALNFCFWPDKDLDYNHLASELKAALLNDKSALDADRLQSYTGPQLRQLLKWPRVLPLEEERIRLLHEVGQELERSFGGEAANLVKACGKSAVSLVTLVARHFPGFRDHSLYKGRQVFLYKRAQIFAADLWGAFKGQGYGYFYDISSEVEIRACSIVAVEKMRELLERKFGKQVLSVEIDLWLWAIGVQNPSLKHHRTLSIYY
ncbi:Queuosine salvage protein family protein [Dioscorea alata]|uniref:Queuosine salvage protein family protein n=1 Tax=Dioscorea alata TaxID=55571 RepID=A0ACB7UWV1_DIOAL|nr:Queuosine salvage protein family protein [Dioscorea alata]